MYGFAQERRSMKRFILIAVFSCVASMCCAQVKFGPVVLGKPVPELPECPSFSSLLDHSATATDDPCVDLRGDTDFSQYQPNYDASFNNLPAPGFSLEAYLMVDCHEDKTTCPIGKFVMHPENIRVDGACATALSAMKRKFGPVSNSRQTV